MSIRRYCRIFLRSFDAHFFIALLPFWAVLHRIFPPYFFAVRSALSINVVHFLAELLNATTEKPLVLVDMDIDSCGLTYLFGLHKDRRILSDSVQGWLHPKYSQMPIVDDEKFETAEDHTMFKRLYPVGSYFGFEDRAILCLPANPGVILGNESNYDAAQSNYVNIVRSNNKWWIDPFVIKCSKFDAIFFER